VGCSGGYEEGRVVERGVRFGWVKEYGREVILQWIDITLIIIL